MRHIHEGGTQAKFTAVKASNLAYATDIADDVIYRLKTLHEF